MQNEIRFFLTLMLCQIKGEENAELGIPKPEKTFEPTYLVQATKLPSGAVELAVNDKCIVEKIEYILNAYEDGENGTLKLKTNPDIVIQNIMIV